MEVMRMLSVLQRPIRHICFYLLHMSDPNTNTAANLTCQTLHGSLPFSNQKNRDNYPRQKALTALRKTSVNKNSRTSNQDPKENFTQSSVKKGPAGGGLTRSLYKLSYKHLQAPSISSRKDLLDDSSASSPHKHLYKKGLH